MQHKSALQRIHPLWWTAVLLVIIVSLITLSMALFAGKLTPSVSVTLASDRAGLVMNPGARVKLRGVQVGRVAGISRDGGITRLQLDIDPDQIKFIPANIGAQINATSVLGAKYVDLLYPDNPSVKRLSTGQVLQSRNVATEVNTVFQDLVDVLHQIDPEKINAILAALAEGVRGQGQRIGQATTAASEVLAAYNERMDTIRADWRSFKAFNDAYDGAANNIVSILDAATTTSATFTGHERDLNALLLNTIGFSRSGIDLIGPNAGNFVSAVNGLQPTTDLLMKYNPEITCTLVGADLAVKMGEQAKGGNGYSLVVDSGLLWGKDPYRYPDNLPIVAAKGGPGGKPGCGSLPDVRKNFPVRALVTNTGWGTGLDIRPNPGIGHPWWADYFPATRAVPENPYFLGIGPPAIGPVPYPGAPPYGAPLYGPDGNPLYPSPPGAPPAPPAPAPPGPPAPDSPPN
jgi:phospholipid/cholesterol/gamma-HCH transport system substrate-binding protein